MKLKRYYRGSEKVKQLPRAALALLLVPGLAAATCKEDIDKFAGTSMLGCGAWPSWQHNATWSPLGLHLTPQRITTADGTQSYLLNLLWDSDHWLFVPAGARLVFLIDGEKTELVTANGSGRRREVSGPSTSPLTTQVTVSETAKFPAERALFEKIAAAKSVEFALYLDDRRLEGKLGRQNLKPFAEFISRTK